MYYDYEKNWLKHRTNESGIDESSMHFGRNWISIVKTL